MQHEIGLKVAERQAMTDTILVTGGAGFIGSAVVRLLGADTNARVVNVDKLTYAASPEAVGPFGDSDRYRLEVADICDEAAVRAVFDRHRPDAVVHLAAETHVDRSIDDSTAFVRTNVLGTWTLLTVALGYYRGLSREKRDRFRFLHVSTDEVYGSLGAAGRFSEDSPYRPSSPYSASKAASDHLVRAWHRTHGLPTMIAVCANNYGPYQFPEKLIPMVILKALAGEPVPVYGGGDNVRDWLFVEDQAKALRLVLQKGRAGQTYCIGDACEKKNIEVVKAVCALLDELAPARGRYGDLIEFVEDRPGHDFRYVTDASRARRELAWSPSVSLEAGLRRTVEWYLENRQWWTNIQKTRYGGERLGIGGK